MPRRTRQSLNQFPFLPSRETNLDPIQLEESEVSGVLSVGRQGFDADHTARREPDAAGQNGIVVSDDQP